MRQRMQRRHQFRPEESQHNSWLTEKACTESANYPSSQLERNDSDYYFEEHSSVMHSAAIVEPDTRARGFEMGLVEAAEAVRDAKAYDICCECSHASGERGQTQ